MPVSTPVRGFVARVGRATATLAARLRVQGPAGGGALADLPLVQQTSLHYEGAFRLWQGPVGLSTFEYAWKGLAFRPGVGSLYMTGHDYQQMVAEIKIPALGVGPLASLNIAPVLQPFRDPTDGRLTQIGSAPSDNCKIGGLLVEGKQLLVSAYVYYDGNGAAKASHFTSGLDLLMAGDARGPMKLSGAGPGFVGGWMCAVPAAWQSALGGSALTGQGCLSIITRTSFGPSAFAFDAANLKDGLAVTPLLYYSDQHPTLGAWDGNDPRFNGATEIGGCVLPGGTRSLLFFGRVGKGPFCYGDGAVCKDPVDAGKGTHGYPYAYQVWAYDALQLALVKAGVRAPWSVLPYAIWNVTLPYVNPAAETRITGVAYDPATGRIFVSQAAGEWPRPIIYVYTLRLN